jgi:hypothetical protein
VFWSDFYFPQGEWWRRRRRERELSQKNALYFL